MLSIFENVAKVIGSLAAFMMAVERPDEGEEKKQEVIESMQKFINEFEGDLPGWLIDIISNEKILSILIDLLHKGLKQAGFLE